MTEMIICYLWLHLLCKLNMSSFSESEEHGSETDFEGFLKRGSLQKLDLDGLSESLLHCSMIGLPFQPMKS